MNDFLIKNNSLRTFSIVSYLIITIILLIIIGTPQANGYEISLYDAYSIIFWILIVFVLLLSTFLSLNMFFLEEIYNKTKFFLVWGPSLLTLFIVMVLPFLRGYIVYGRGDVLSHIGYIKYIISYSQIYNDGYPLSHIFVAIFNNLSGIDIYSIIILLPAIFLLFYIYWTLKLGKTVLKIEYLLYLMIILIFIIHFERIEQFSPFNLSLFLVPMFIYTLYKKDKISYSLLFVILLFTITFMHIFVALTMVLVTIVFFFTRLFWKKLVNSNINLRFIQIKKKSIQTNNRLKSPFIKTNMNTLVLVGTVVLSWAIVMYLGRIGDVITWVIYTGGKETLISSGIKGLNEAGLNLYEFIYTFFVGYANLLFIYLFPFLLALILWLKKAKIVFEEKTFYILMLFLSFIILTVLFDFSKDFVTYDRVVRIVVISSVILCTLFIYQLKEKLVNKRSFFIIIYLVLSVMIITNIFILHKSPIAISPNQQVTESELFAGEWFLDNLKYEKVFIIMNNEDIQRYLDSVYDKSAIKSPDYYYYKTSYGIPDEFGYKNYTSFADAMDLEIFKKKYPEFKMYLVFSKIDSDYHKIFFKRLWSRAKTYSPESINKLKNDNRVNELYDNGETQTFVVQ